MTYVLTSKVKIAFHGDGLQNNVESYLIAPMGRVKISVMMSAAARAVR